MKKYALLILCICFSMLILTGCKFSQNSPIKYERKFGKYFGSSDAKSTSTSGGGVIDLSEGPKLRYDAKLGPSDLNFDIKIVNPYW
ncbi:MAG: hypothetical protein E7Z89_08340 [Cyanobacteria bacterium SIG28]|nr:hypothetical protein [Cyanobacteria bacterium SIG28]